MRAGRDGVFAPLFGLTFAQVVVVLVALPLTGRHARWPASATPGAETPDDDVPLTRTRP